MSEDISTIRRPNREKAIALLAQGSRGQIARPRLVGMAVPLQDSRPVPQPQASSGTAIAATTSAAVREALAAIHPGASFRAEMEIHHQDEHGAKTMAKCSFMHWGAK